MRLWHKDLIHILPRQQLVAQWRELSSIAGSIKQKGTPNHILVNFVLEYSWNDFISYTYYIRQEMTKRGYRTMDSVWNKICSLSNNDYNILPIEEIYTRKMDEQYLTICVYNLYEKYLCGGIDKKDWNKILEVVNGKIKTDN